MANDEQTSEVTGKHDIGPYSDEYTVPYEFQTSDGASALLYYGTQHVRVADDPTYADIRERFESFSPDLVIIEGVERLHPDRITPEVETELAERISNMSEVELIPRLGEPMFTAKLAISKGIKVISAEPTMKTEINYLEQSGIKPEEIFGFYVFRMVTQWSRTSPRPKFEEYIEPLLDEMKHSTHWSNFAFTLDNAVNIHKQILGINFDEGNSDYYHSIIDPTESEGQHTIFNKISRLSNDVRDQEIVRVIDQARRTYKRIFVVYGAGHAYVQRRALEKVFSSN